MQEVALDSGGLFLHAAQVARGGVDQLQLGTRWRLLGHRLLQGRVGQLVRIQLRAVAGQVEHLDLLLVRSQRRPYRLGGQCSDFCV
jgi:hypothetical protein